MNKTIKFPLISSIILLTSLIACLAVAADNRLFLSLNALANQLPAGIWSFITTLADPKAAPLLVLACFYKQPLFLRAFFIAVIMALFTNYSLKYGFDFQRPNIVLEASQFTLSGPSLTSPSFPSGHSLVIFTMMGLISTWYQKPTLSVILFIIAAIVAFSRIAVGVHWPSDVLFGALLGWTIGWLAVVLNNKLSNYINHKVKMAMYGCGLLTGIVTLVTKTAYPEGQWLSTAIALFAIAYCLRSLTELMHAQKG